MTAPFPRLDDLEAALANAALGSLRVGEHYGIHLYAGENPVGTTLRPADATAIAASFNAVPQLIARVRELEAQQTAVQALADAWSGDRYMRGVPPEELLAIVGPTTSEEVDR